MALLYNHFHIFFPKRKGKFSYINFTSSAQHNFKCNIFVCETIFLMKAVFQHKQFFNAKKFPQRN